jgi:hypothetical protein
MTQPLTDDDIPEFITGDIHRSHTVILCDKCNGYGFSEKEELTDYHKREYTTYRSSCSKCEGDGRMIQTEISYTVRLPQAKVETMPYASFKDIVEPHLNESKWFRMRPDFRDYKLERLYPELAELAYHKYDELAKVCLSMHNMSKEQQ